MKRIITATVIACMACVVTTSDVCAFVKKNPSNNDRYQEVKDVSNSSLKQLAKSTLVLMKKEDAEKLLRQERLPTLREKGIPFYPDPLSHFSFKVRPSRTVKYASQPSIGLCSGFLIAKDVLVTAGHCPSDKKNMVWVKNYQYNSNMEIKITPDDIFSIVEVLEKKFSNPTPVYERVIDPRFEDTTPDSWDYSNVVDYAVIKIGQKKDILEKNEYLTPRLEGKTKAGDELIVIGNPLGAPTKITTAGSVLHWHKKVIITDLDAYMGNSGGAAINQDTRKVEGILVRTGPSFTRGEKEDSYVIKYSEKERVASNELTELTPMFLIPNIEKYIGKPNNP